MKKKMGKSKSKRIYLISGKERDFHWQLAVNASKKQPNWDGTFYLDNKINKSKIIFLATGKEKGYPWVLRVNISAKRPNYEGSFYLEEKARKSKDKKIALMTSSERGFFWQLSVNVSFSQSNWSGNFYLTEERRQEKSRRIYLAGGGVKGYSWKLQIDIGSNQQQQWMGNFSLQDEVQKYRDYRRKKDRNWASRKFPQRWLQQFEIHHRWSDETCYFLTPEEHREQDRKIRYGLC